VRFYERKGLLREPPREHPATATMAPRGCSAHASSDAVPGLHLRLHHPLSVDEAAVGAGQVYQLDAIATDAKHGVPRPAHAALRPPARAIALDEISI